MLRSLRKGQGLFWHNLVFKCHFESVTAAMYLVDFFDRKVMHEILTAVKYMHSKNIVHRDLKVWNILT